jgi:hypothetical protein
MISAHGGGCRLADGRSGYVWRRLRVPTTIVAVERMVVAIGMGVNCGDMVATGITSERYRSFLFSAALKALMSTNRFTRLDMASGQGLCTKPAFDEHRLIINIISIYIYVWVSVAIRQLLVG